MIYSVKTASYFKEFYMDKIKKVKIKPLLSSRITSVMTRFKLSKLMMLASAVLLSFSAWSLTLDEAKDKGLVGETSSGYLGLVKQNTEAEAVVDEVNDKRKSHYQNLAKKNGISLSQVEALAAAKAIEKTASGHFIQVNGRWVKK